MGTEAQDARSVRTLERTAPGSGMRAQGGQMAPCRPFAATVTLASVSREDANLAVAVLGLFVAAIASVYAIRRDRADLRVTSEDAGAGNHWLIVANVGTRAVRIERLMVRRWRFLRSFGSMRPIQGFVLRSHRKEEHLPTAVHPAASVLLHYHMGEFADFVTRRNYEIVVEDAAGRDYRVRADARMTHGPDGF